MVSRMAFLALLSAFVLYALAMANIAPRSQTFAFRDDIVAETGGLYNIYMTYKLPLDGELSIHYGSCDVVSPAKSTITPWARRM